MQSYFKSILKEAVSSNSTDIYLLPENEYYQIKFHNGRRPRSFRIISQLVAEKLFSFLKFRAQMNITENRRPQMGSMDWSLDKQNLSLRISTVGDFKNQETMVIRILYDREIHNLIWLKKEQFFHLKQIIPSQGLVVVAGPTGSGKTSTIHELLREYTGEKLILTIEDPVEIKNAKFIQLQINQHASMSYLDLIKVALRHHPDILLIGEIRDSQTAQATVQAALSGHLVFSTIHANSANTVSNRLLELGVDKSLLKDVLKLTIYQRLLQQADGSLAAVADWKEERQIFDQSAKNFGSSWKETLDGAFKSKRISSKIYEEYKKIAA